MLCFNKLTGEHNTKKYFKKFSFCVSISLSLCYLPNKKVGVLVRVGFYPHDPDCNV